MNEIIKSSKDLVAGLKAEYEELQEEFKAETDVNKMDALDTQISEIGKTIVALETKLLALEVAAKKSAFDPGRLGPLAKSMTGHSQETTRAIKEYTDSIARAKYLASRVISGAKLIGDIAKKIV